MRGRSFPLFSPSLLVLPLAKRLFISTKKPPIIARRLGRFKPFNNFIKNLAVYIFHYNNEKDSPFLLLFL